ncbi:hypothetical protein Val02_48900 [Virgisporangium aliadipatigenens]|uniref:ATP-grasp domain-containing protein n=1 Tax=Virgisporangium aliadipatigenens TaxID=741659 RepID=A0A8J3YM42_9ACTN|nr:ATP-grasp domain-containing protein [Virgisporangium aliadipatigenens]GIJ48004.1 hypothetical protein Val02_48900 [Virgisporangium aliadipatigenens]
MTAGEGLPLVGVVLDFGAATPMSVLAAARGLARIVFLGDRGSAYVRAVVADLDGLADVWDITDLSNEDIAADPRMGTLAGITTFSERQLVRTAALAHRHGLTFLSPAAAAAATDKFLQRRLLSEAGLEHLRCRLLRDPEQLDAALADVGLPAVLKPRRGAASARTCRVDSAAEAHRRLRDFVAAAPPDEEYVVEQFLTGDSAVAGERWGDYVSVESVTSHGRTRHIDITGKFPLAPPLRETGYVVPATLDPPVRRSVLRLVEAAIRALGIAHGATHVEVKLTPSGPQIIEVNGRLGGYVADLVRRARGYDLLRAALLAALGRPADPPPELWRRHAFQYFLTPPMNATVLRRFDGADDLIRERGIQLVETVKRPGDPLDWRDGTLAYIGIVHGSGTDHADVLRLVERIRHTLLIEYHTAADHD